jgi:hypothetical protein
MVGNVTAVMVARSSSPHSTTPSTRASAACARWRWNTLELSRFNSPASEGDRHSMLRERRGALVSCRVYKSLRPRSVRNRRRGCPRVGDRGRRGAAGHNTLGPGVDAGSGIRTLPASRPAEHDLANSQTVIDVSVFEQWWMPRQGRHLSQTSTTLASVKSSSLPSTPGLPRCRSRTPTLHLHRSPCPSTFSQRIEAEKQDEVTASTAKVSPTFSARQLCALRGTFHFGALCGCQYEGDQPRAAIDHSRLRLRRLHRNHRLGSHVPHKRLPVGG